MQKNLRKQIVTAKRLAGVTLLAIGACLLSPSAMAYTYLSGYSGGSSSYKLWDGSQSHYVSRSGQGRLSSTHIERIHNREYQRLAKERAARAARYQWYDKNPPCGIYGRVPTRCKKMESRF